MSSRAGGGGEASDEALAAAANAGDRGALEVLLARHLDRVHAICRRVTGHPEDALDATQEALIAVTRGLHRYDGRSLFTTWLYRVATNAALDELRRRKRAATLAAEPTDLDAPSPEDEADLALRREAVRAALAELPPRERELIALKFHAGLDNAELAKVLDVSVSNAGTLLCRAMQKLRKAIDAHA
jgi:RNA polymerase sigma-70 factor, ECF subfamily